MIDKALFVCGGNSHLSLVFLLFDNRRLWLAVYKAVLLGHKLLGCCLGGLRTEVLNLGLAEDDVGVRCRALEDVWLLNDKEYLQQQQNAVVRNEGLIFRSHDADTIFFGWILLVGGAISIMLANSSVINFQKSEVRSQVLSLSIDTLKVGLQVHPLAPASSSSGM